MQTDFSQWCPVTGKEAMSTNKKHMEFHLNIRKMFLSCKSGQTLEQATQGGCGVPILGHTQTQLDTIQGSLL